MINIEPIRIFYVSAKLMAETITGAAAAGSMTLPVHGSVLKSVDVIDFGGKMARYCELEPNLCDDRNELETPMIKDNTMTVGHFADLLASIRGQIPDYLPIIISFYDPENKENKIQSIIPNILKSEQDEYIHHAVLTNWNVYNLPVSYGHFVDHVNKFNRELPLATNVCSDDQLNSNKFTPYPIGTKPIIVETDLTYLKVDISCVVWMLRLFPSE